MGGRGRDASRRRRRARWLAAAAAMGLVAAPAGWIVSDRLEQENRFCVSCHLEADTRLHIGLLEDFEARPPAVLAAAHAAAGSGTRRAGRSSARSEPEASGAGAGDGRFRCIDCHGGTGLLGRARVKLLSARDAFWYAVGRFEEPEGMRWPLWDADCRKCHDAFEERRAAFGDPLFHELPAHRSGEGGDFAVRCVECHLAHEPGALPEHDFLLPAVVRGQCARCHPEFEEERG